ncbi:MAG: hypothetical protein ACI4ES_07300 [Roseburia sp.]
MMNKEMIYRMKIAGEYQRKAIRALFPEEMGEHMDVIEKELKMMVMEVITELLKECNRSDACRDRQSHEQTSKVKKVDIV